MCPTRNAPSFLLPAADLSASFGNTVRAVSLSTKKPTIALHLASAETAIFVESGASRMKTTHPEAATSDAAHGSINRPPAERAHFFRGIAGFRLV